MKKTLDEVIEQVESMAKLANDRIEAEPDYADRFGQEATEQRQLAEWLKELRERRAPIPMILFCPMCHTRHVDKGDFATRPHHTHACQSETCGFVWRPAKHTTIGVQHLPGFKDDDPV